MTKILKKYPNGKTYDTNSVTVLVDNVPYKTVQKHNVGAIKYELKQLGITKDKITTKLTFNT